MTRPAAPTVRAAVTAGSPFPVATSRTVAPDLNPASSTRRSLTCCAARSNTGHHFFQPAAATSQSRRCSLLNRPGSKLCSAIGSTPSYRSIALMFPYHEPAHVRQHMRVGACKLGLLRQADARVSDDDDAGSRVVADRRHT